MIMASVKFLNYNFVPRLTCVAHYTVFGYQPMRFGNALPVEILKARPSAPSWVKQGLFNSATQLPGRQYHEEV